MEVKLANQSYKRSSQLLELQTIESEAGICFKSSGILKKKLNTKPKTKAKKRRVKSIKK